MVRNLVKNTDDVRHPYLTPLNAESHAGLPPAILVTNGFDPLRDVGHAYAQKLAAAGNEQSPQAARLQRTFVLKGLIPLALTRSSMGDPDTHAG
jgi:acetyl esterase/lipase